MIYFFSGKFTCLEVVFKFKRRLGYYLFHTYVPTCLIVIMSWISFWIKPEAVPARVTLGVTSLLTLSTQHANSQKSLPPVSYIKAIGKKKYSSLGIRIWPWSNDRWLNYADLNYLLSRKYSSKEKQWIDFKKSSKISLESLSGILAGINSKMSCFGVTSVLEIWSAKK